MPDQKLFRIADRWRKGETPTENEITEVYGEFPDILDRMASFMNGLANIADTDISATQLRHMAARYLGRDVLPETSKGHQAAGSHDCIVPVLDGQPLINAIGSNDNECHANLALIDLTDDELQRVELIASTVQVPIKQ